MVPGLISVSTASVFALCIPLASTFVLRFHDKGGGPFKDGVAARLMSDERDGRVRDKTGEKHSNGRSRCYSEHWFWPVADICIEEKQRKARREVPSCRPSMSVSPAGEKRHADW